MLMLHMLLFFDKYHHNIIYAKINIWVPLVFIREVWNYSKTDVQSIQKAILNFNRWKSFESLSVDSKSDLLYETLLNIFRNFVWNKKKIKCDYRQPPWVTDGIKKYLKERSKLTKGYYKKWSAKKWLLLSARKFCWLHQENHSS